MGGLGLTISGWAGLLNKKASIVSKESTTATTARDTITIKSVPRPPMPLESSVGESAVGESTVGESVKENVGTEVGMKSVGEKVGEFDGEPVG